MKKRASRPGGKSLLTPWSVPVPYLNRRLSTVASTPPFSIRRRHFSILTKPHSIRPQKNIKMPPQNLQHITHRLAGSPSGVARMQLQFHYLPCRPSPHHPTIPPKTLTQIATTRRLFSTTPKSKSRQSPPSPTDPTTTTTTSIKTSSSQKLQRVLARLPPSLQKYTTRLRSAPVSHIVAFLVLHELTAIISLLALFGVFHYAATGPTDDSDSASKMSVGRLVGYILDRYGATVGEGAAKFERYFSRKGWFGFTTTEAQTQTQTSDDKEVEQLQKYRESDDGKYRIAVEIGLAYVLTKALLPARIVVSVWATPWFAGVIARLRSFAMRKK
ncbi:hypothetical protein B0H66DRAFT_529621 [Apodospora peruviana]|uniref:Uncharacterized protein n=1 Tax=Apodospora peruviana TaxID=516989 RepID=A0AAE0MB28_9PEZI|nr:hypothetical protein B0H66DRAFT_529621 [Apodospora peruviana]